MARTFHRKKPLEAVSEINVTPLIDLAFALLIIFMITAPLLEQTIELDLPTQQPDAGSAKAPVETRTISIDREGRVFWEGDAVNAAELGRRLDDVAARTDPPVLAIRGDRQVRLQALVDVLAAVKERGLTRVAIDTEVR